MVHRLKTVTRTQGNNRALKDRSVTPAGFELVFEEVPVLVHAFRRMVRDLEFDVCEMALTTYLTAKEHGVAFTALPVFLVRGFHHGAIQCRVGSGIEKPADLIGGRVGVNRGYTVTTGVWARGILASEYGLDLDRITWVLSGDEHVATYQPPPNVVSAPEGNDLGEMLLAGELDAVIGLPIDNPDVRPLIPDPDEAAYEALRTRGLYPINHLVVVRDRTLDQHPEAASAVFDAFVDAKQMYLKRLWSMGDVERTPIDQMYQRVWHATGSDPLPYGVAPNRAVLQDLIDHAQAQHILRNSVDVEDLFEATTLDRRA